MIQVEHLNKSFTVRKREGGLKASFRSFFSSTHEVVQALNDLSFTIDDGEMVAYIGPNGAGKSTTIKILSGVLVPDSGRCEIQGRIPWAERKAHVRDIGVVFGQRSQLFWDVPVIDSFLLLKDIYELPSAVYEESLAELSELLNLKDLLKTPVRQLSLGQRMRCEIAASLLHQPKILFLDEPTIGLDAPSKSAVRRFILQLNQQRKTTVILTTHDMQDVEALAQRVLLIGRGRLLLDGSLDQLRQSFGHVKLLQLSTDAPLRLPRGGELLWQKEDTSRIRLDLDQTTIEEALADLSAHHGIRDLLIEDQNIDELVAKLYEQYAIA